MANASGAHPVTHSIRVKLNHWGGLQDAGTKSVRTCIAENPWPNVPGQTSQSNRPSRDSLGPTFQAKCPREMRLAWLNAPEDLHRQMLPDMEKLEAVCLSFLAAANSLQCRLHDAVWVAERAGGGSPI
ncbi:MAG: hypothetical protein M1837_004788 [Sclerophora amabilis]|nr:MAG: hypothetical protein M1837_004788 [Sclerophora amabilis]